MVDKPDITSQSERERCVVAVSDSISGFDLRYSPPSANIAQDAGVEQAVPSSDVPKHHHATLQLDPTRIPQQTCHKLADQAGQGQDLQQADVHHASETRDMESPSFSPEDTKPDRQDLHSSHPTLSGLKGEMTATQTYSAVSSLAAVKGSVKAAGSSAGEVLMIAEPDETYWLPCSSMICPQSEMLSMVGAWSDNGASHLSVHDDAEAVIPIVRSACPRHSV